MNIPVGYQLHVFSWENDMDNCQTRILSGLTKVDVEFYLFLCGHFTREVGGQGTMGNNFNTRISLRDIAVQGMEKFPCLTKRIQDRFSNYLCLDDPLVDLGDTDMWELFNFLGTPGDSYYSNPGGSLFCRRVDRVEVYLIPVRIQNVSKEFRIK